MKETNPWLVGAFIVVAILGFFAGGYFLSTEKEVPFEVIKEIPIEIVKTVIVPVEKNITIEKEIKIPDATKYLEQAKLDIFKELKDDDDFLTCENYTYDDNEISISNVREWSYNWEDDDLYEIFVKAKFKYKTEDEKACYRIDKYKLTYEESEDVEVELVKP